MNGNNSETKNGASNKTIASEDRRRADIREAHFGYECVDWSRTFYATLNDYKTPISIWLIREAIERTEGVTAEAAQNAVIGAIRAGILTRVDDEKVKLGKRELKQLEFYQNLPQHLEPVRRAKARFKSRGNQFYLTSGDPSSEALMQQMEMRGIPETAARYLINGAKSEDRLFQDRGKIHMGLPKSAFNGDSTPEWLRWAKEIVEFGVCRLFSNREIISIDTPMLIKRVNQKNQNQMINRRRVISHVCESTGISREASSKITNDLIDEGVLQEEPIGRITISKEVAKEAQLFPKA